MRAGVGFHRDDGGWGEGSEVEDARNPACWAECVPDQKCSQPKCELAWLPPEGFPEECPPPERLPPKRPPPEWPPPPPCCASPGARSQMTHSKIARTHGDRTRKAVRVAMGFPPGKCNSSLLLFAYSRICDFQLSDLSALSLSKRLARGRIAFRSRRTTRHVNCRGRPNRNVR